MKIHSNLRKFTCMSRNVLGLSSSRNYKDIMRFKCCTTHENKLSNDDHNALQFSTQQDLPNQFTDCTHVLLTLHAICKNLTDVYISGTFHFKF